MALRTDIQESVTTMRAQLLRAHTVALLLDTFLSRNNFVAAYEALETIHASIERAINAKDTIYEHVKAERDARQEERSSRARINYIDCSGCKGGWCKGVENGVKWQCVPDSNVMRQERQEERQERAPGEEERQEVPLSYSTLDGETLIIGQERKMIIPLEVTFEYPGEYIGIKVCMLASQEEEESIFDRSKWQPVPLLEQRLKRAVPSARVTVVHHITRKDRDV